MATQTNSIEVHHMLFYIAANPDPSKGQLSGPEADAHVNTYFAQGWKLNTVQAMKVEEGAVLVFYCLTRGLTAA